MTPLPIPDEALNSHVGVLGKVGSGKTYTAKGLVERLLHARRQAVIVDPTGAWYGLRTGFDVPIFGGRHGDIEVTDKAGDAVAAVIVDQRASAIVDLSLMSGAAQRRFMTSFAHRLRQKPPGALWLVLDEADEFLPQQLSPDMTNLFGDLKWMVRRGRLNGFRVMMITQRPAEIAKAVLTQIETLVAHRLTAPQDRKAIEEWVKGHHDPAEAREVLSTLAGLDQGEAWVWAPDLGILKREKMPPIETFDSSRTPEPGEAAVEPPALASLDLSAIRDALAPSDSVPADPATAYKEGGAVGAALKERDERIRRLEADNAALEQDRDQWKRRAATRMVLIERARAALQASGDEVSEPTPEPRTLAEGAGFETPSGSHVSMEPRPGMVPRKREAVPGEATRGAHQKVLDALAWWKAAGFPAVDRRRACIMAGYSPKASTFGVYISELVRAGLVEVPEPGKLQLTAQGEARAQAPATTAGGDLLQAARDLLNPAEVKVFEEVANAWPQPIARADLADRVGLSRTASTLGVYLSKIGSFGFVESGRGTVRAADWLFPEVRT